MEACIPKLKWVLWFVQKKKKPETLVIHISEMAGAIYFKFGTQPPVIGRHFHGEFGDLWIKDHGSMNT